MGRRRRAPSRAFTAVLLTGALALACNELTGSGELAAVAPSSGTPVDGGGLPPVDAAPPVVIDPPKPCPSVGRRCVAAPPADWVGPLLVFEGATADVPACPSSMAVTRVDAHGGMPSGGHRCAACSCGPPTGATCNANLRQFDLDGCEAVDRADPMTVDQCVPISEDVESMRLIVVTSGAGSCAPSSASPILDPIVWPRSLKGCGAPELLADGCSAGSVCAPEPSAPFLSASCVVHAGDVPCPSGWPDKRSANAGADDDRTCSGCSCGAPSGVSCTATITRHTGTTCAGAAIATIPNPTECHPVAEGNSVRLTALAGSGGSCVSTGSATPSGSVRARDPITVCCAPER